MLDRDRALQEGRDDGALLRLEALDELEQLGDRGAHDTPRVLARAARRDQRDPATVLLVAKLPAGSAPRSALLGLRALDWALFSSFGRVARRTDSAAAVLALTAAQALATAEVMRRTRRVDGRIGRALAPQLVWLTYASAVPVLMARRLRR